MEYELTEIVGRKVDLRTPNDLSPFFRDEVLANSRILYVSKDFTRLKHILEAYEAILIYVRNKSREDLDKDRMLLEPLLEN